jgi:uncharacterized protein
LVSEGKGWATRFFALTYVLSWAIWLPLMFVRLGVLSIGLPSATVTPLALLGVLMPSAAALILASRRFGGEGVRSLVGRLLIWRVGWWWAFVLVLQPVILVLTVILNDVLGWGAPVRLTYPASISALSVSVLFLAIAATGEEVGWRGYALPALQSVRTPLRSSVILGLVVATWHIPYWVLQGILGVYGIGYFVLNYLFVVAITIQLTWIFNRTRSSVLVAIAFHVVFNVVNVTLLPVTSSVSAFTVLTVIEFAVALSMLGSLGLRPGETTVA